MSGSWSLFFLVVCKKVGQLLVHSFAILMGKLASQFIPKYYLGQKTNVYTKLADSNIELMFIPCIKSRTTAAYSWRVDSRCFLQALSEVCEYEQNVCPIILDSSNTLGQAYFDITSPQTLPSKYVEIFTKKSHLILRMMENRLGKELLLQVNYGPDLFCTRRFCVLS